MKLILLGILKGIGIVLLALLLLLLLCVLAVLLSPLRYRLMGEKQEELSGSFAVSWLWGAVKGSGTYAQTGGMQLHLRLLWFDLIGGKPKEKKKKKQKKERKQEETVRKPDLQAAEKQEAAKPTEEAEQTAKAETAGSEKPVEKAEMEPIEKTETAESKEPKKQADRPKQRMAEKQPKTMRRVQLSQIQEKPPLEEAEPFLEEEGFFTGETAETEKKREIPPAVRELWQTPEKKAILQAFGQMLKRLMQHILPGDFFLKGTFGTGDPAATGYLLAAAGLLKARFGEDIQIKGEFTKAAAEDICLRLKGRIRLGSLLWIVLAFLCKKPVRQAIRQWIRFLKQKDDSAEKNDA